MRDPVLTQQCSECPSLLRRGTGVRLVVFQNMEEMFYKFLKKDREFNNPRWPFYIKVKDVQGKVMYDATFKHRTGDPKNPSRVERTL